ncbi:hypothetical protein [Nitrosomonas sp.]|uniref:hypothetical protein n=1 Tax=Nitrosomonas sp. TaxID=42353 RepID=UPI001D5839FC|nr:hypothetical protein [Nitrosomonas sp.]MCB1949634.1 hypothetical protein [Nitrosomonas sp.]
MQINNFSKCIVLFVAVLISACSGPKHAKDAAIQMNRITLEYDAEVSKKVDAEKAFYNKQRKDLRNVLSGSTDITKPPEAKQNTTTEPQSKFTENNNSSGNETDNVKNITIKDTVVYGQIRTKAQRDAILLSEKLSGAQTQLMIRTNLFQFIRNGLEEDWNAYRDANHRQQQLRVELLEGLEKIDQQTSRLKTIQKELEKLSKDPSIQSSFKQYLKIGEAITEKLKAKK